MINSTEGRGGQGDGPKHPEKQDPQLRCVAPQHPDVKFLCVGPQHPDVKFYALCLEPVLGINDA